MAKTGLCPTCGLTPLSLNATACPKCGETQFITETWSILTEDRCPACKGSRGGFWDNEGMGANPKRVWREFTCYTCLNSGFVVTKELTRTDFRTGEVTIRGTVKAPGVR